MEFKTRNFKRQLGFTTCPCKEGTESFSTDCPVVGIGNVSPHVPAKRELKGSTGHEGEEDIIPFHHMSLQRGN